MILGNWPYNTCSLFGICILDGSFFLGVLSRGPSISDPTVLGSDLVPLLFGSAQLQQSCQSYKPIEPGEGEPRQSNQAQ